MVDFEKIGRRITEQRNMLGISQRKMADELQNHYLSMHQGDISRLEKAQKGSGITDLDRLDRIAEYLGIPLETLIFGTGGGMLQKYYGDTMAIKRSKKKPLKSHFKILSVLIGRSEEELQDVPIAVHECGPYTIYSMQEIQQQLYGKDQTTKDGVPIAQYPLQVLHTWIFCNQELVAVMTTALTTVMHHVMRPMLEGLLRIMQRDAIDPAAVYGTLNPYWTLYQYPTSTEDYNKNYELMFKRMDELRALGENNTILYVKSVYVREDYRQSGIFRMFVDYLRLEFGKDESLIWLNMEPTTGDELEHEYRCLTSYTISDLGQLNINAAIAEKIGFKVDPSSYYRQALALNDDGTTTIDTVPVRKYAYLLPRKYRELLQQDGNLAEQGQARQHVAEEQSEEKYGIDLKHGPIDGYEVVEVTNNYISGARIGQKISAYAARSRKEPDKFRFGVSRRSVVDSGLFHDGQMENYDYIDDAKDSDYLDQLELAYRFLVVDPLGILDQDNDVADKVFEDPGVAVKELSAGMDAGYTYLKRIHFQNRPSPTALSAGLLALYGEKMADALYTERERIQDGSLEFYEYKNQNVDISSLISECFDADTLRQMCNYLYKNRQFIKGDVLEVGCESGYITGFLAMYFPNIHITAIDRSKCAVEIARKRMEQWGIHNVEFRVADLADITDQFDTVISLRILNENLAGNPDIDEEIDIFDGDDLPYQLTAYRALTFPYASILCKAVKDNGHIVSIERIPMSPGVYGWLESLNDLNCGFIKDTHESLHCNEVDGTTHYTAVIAACDRPVADNAVMDYVMTSMYELDDEYNSKTDCFLKGWPGIVYFFLAKGEGIKDIFIIDPDGHPVGRFAAYYDRNDPTTILYYELMNDINRSDVGRYDVSKLNELLDLINNIAKDHVEHGFTVEPFDSAKRYGEDADDPDEAD